MKESREIEAGLEERWSSEKLRIVKKKTNSEENGIIAPNPNLGREYTNESLLWLFDHILEVLGNYP